MSYRHLLASTCAAASLSMIGSAGHAAQVFATDLIVQGSACVGFDCTSSESFGSDTLRLKENNLRIHFDDTSGSASFPNNDWRLVANDSTNGGSNYFAIEDSTAGRIPFRVEAGAIVNALYVDSEGDVGIGTNTPAVEVHAVDGNSPTLRLEQNGSSGFTPYTWDLAGNETNFFIRDVTNGSKLPFRIKPGAGDNAIFIDAESEVGIGTDSPHANLHVRAGGASHISSGDISLMVQNNANAADAARIQVISGDSAIGQLIFGTAGDEFAGRVRYSHASDVMELMTNGRVALAIDGSGGTGGSGSNDVISTVTSTAVLTAAGVWQNASSRALKQNINALSLEDAVETLQGLEPVTYNYKVEPNELTVGFIAEDVPDMVATASHKTLSGLDIVAVLTRVVQDQSAVIATLEDQAAARDARLEQLEALIAQ